MDKIILELEFLDTNEKKIVIRVDDPKPDLNDMAVAAAMENILVSGAFTNKGASLSQVNGARKVTTTVSDFNLA